jgi:hypothetical protein
MKKELCFKLVGYLQRFYQDARPTEHEILSNAQSARGSG